MYGSLGDHLGSILFLYGGWIAICVWMHWTARRSREPFDGRGGSGHERFAGQPRTSMHLVRPTGAFSPRGRDTRRTRGVEKRRAAPLR